MLQPPFESTNFPEMMTSNHMYYLECTFSQHVPLANFHWVSGTCDKMNIWNVLSHKRFNWHKILWVPGAWGRVTHGWGEGAKKDEYSWCTSVAEKRTVETVDPAVANRSQVRPRAPPSETNDNEDSMLSHRVVAGRRGAERNKYFSTFNYYMFFGLCFASLFEPTS